MISLTPCKSKMLQAYGYDSATETLAVRFGASKVYHYKNVPPDVFAELQKAESVGTAFATMVRGQYAHEVALDEPEAAKDAA